MSQDHLKDIFAEYPAILRIITDIECTAPQERLDFDSRARAIDAWGHLQHLASIREENPAAFERDAKELEKFLLEVETREAPRRYAPKSTATH